MQKAVLELRLLEVAQIGGDHQGQPDGLPAPGQGVAELCGRLQGGGAGREDGRVGKVVGGDLEQL